MTSLSVTGKTSSFQLTAKLPWVVEKWTEFELGSEKSGHVTRRSDAKPTRV
jgi:hypothetical protein